MQMGAKKYFAPQSQNPTYWLKLIDQVNTLYSQNNKSNKMDLSLKFKLKQD